jgi:hypothetical protein
MRLLILTQDELYNTTPYDAIDESDLCIVIFKDDTFRIIRNRYGPEMTHKHASLPLNEPHEVVIVRL